MKTAALVLLMACPCARVLSQPNYFEGDIQYHVSVKSTVPALSDMDARKILAEGEVLTVSFKNGSYKRSSALQDEYYIGKEQKVYIKFRKIDTLYYMDYSADSTVLSGVTRSDSIFTIDHHACKVITITSSTGATRYYYAPDLLNDPTYSATDKIGLFNVYTRETGGAIYLWAHREFAIAATTDSCIRIEPKKLDDHLLDPPHLPVKKFDIASLLVPARYPGNANAWLRYLEANLDSKMAGKYVRLSKGQQEASVTVFVAFKVSENGTISDIMIVNRNDVHPKLAAEAERVIRESPRWQPALIYGEKVSYPVRQPIVFKVTKE